ncbi:MAG: GSCFA domain-containing protein [Bacteroidales bacterium]|nr:GSCFA domain-containing protein [Bacteroidales bacterium]
MAKACTKVEISKFPVKISTSDIVSVLGSCFANEMGSRMKEAGYNVCVNPFGTLFNPVSIANSIARLDSAIPFRADECVEMGAGAGKICSWWHHTSFARLTAEEFLDNANRALQEASAFWKSSNKVIITLGTAMVWKLVNNGEVVSNCLKRPSREFSHEMLSVSQTAAVLERIVRSHQDKEFIFTVSPIRHMGEGAHQNTVSKATLQLAIEAIGATYFPAYEIMLDELRDYRWFAEDLVHPSKEAADYIWERFHEAIR